MQIYPSRRRLLSGSLSIREIKFSSQSDVLQFHVLVSHNLLFHRLEADCSILQTIHCVFSSRYFNTAVIFFFLLFIRRFSVSSSRTSSRAFFFLFSNLFKKSSSDKSQWRICKITSCYQEY